jgi:hypothetical protein
MGKQRLEQVAPAGDAATRFAAALTAGDRDGARASCDDAGWSGGEDPIEDFVDQIVGKAVNVEPIGLPQGDDRRAAVRLVLSRAGDPRPPGDVWALLVPDPWRVVGLTKVRNRVGLFLSGAVDALTLATDLPEDPAAAAWLADQLTRDPEFAGLPAGARVTGSAGALGRAGVRVETPEGTRWVIVSERPREAREVKRKLRFEPLFRGLVLRWPHSDA